MKDTNHCCPRDIHPGDYVFANLYIKEDNTIPAQTVIKADIVTPTYLGVIEGSGVTKYAWSEIYPISLTKDNLAKFDLYLISGPGDHCSIFAKDLVTIDAEYHIGDDGVISARVFFNDNDGEDMDYLHEVQEYIYKRTKGAYNFDIKPKVFECTSSF